MKVLISQTASLGDVILSTPVISAVKELYPGSQIWFLTTQAGAELLREDPDLSGVLIVDKKGKDSGFFGFLRKRNEIAAHKFDVLYAIQRSARISLLLACAGIKKRVGFKSSSLPFLFTETLERPKCLHDVQRNLAIVKAENKSFNLQLISPQFETLSAEVKELVTQGPYVAIFPGSLWYSKRWHPNNFVGLAKEIKKIGLRPIFFGSKAEEGLVELCAKESGSIGMAGKTSMREVVYLVANAQLLVCNDSSSLHIASAFKIPNLAVFCSTSPSMGFGPWQNDKSIVLEEQNLWCRPCARHGGSFCPTGTEACMKGSGNAGVSVNAALTGVKQLLSI